MGKRIVVIGNNTIAAQCLDALVAAGENVIAVMPEPFDEGQDGWQRSLKKAATDHGLYVFQPPKIHEPAALDHLRSLEPDILFSLQNRRILKQPFISLFPMGCVNLHFAPLPYYRGCYPIAWALINGEREHGVTLHYIDEGIDTGDLIYQVPVPITPDDTGRTLFDRCAEAGAELFARSFESILAGASPRHVQEGAGSYYDKYSLDFKQNRVGWDRPAAAVQNWIRAFIFPPFQFPQATLGSTEVGLSRTELDDQPADRAPGTAVPLGDGSVAVSAQDGRVRVLEVMHEGQAVRPAALIQ